MQSPPPDENAFIELGDTMIETFSVKNPAPQSKNDWQIGCRRIAIEVDNLDDAIKYLKTKGVPIISGPVAAGRDVVAQIKDPEGMIVQLVQKPQ